MEPDRLEKDRKELRVEMSEKDKIEMGAVRVQKEEIVFDDEQPQEDCIAVGECVEEEGGIIANNEGLDKVAIIKLDKLEVADKEIGEVSPELEGERLEEEVTAGEAEGAMGKVEMQHEMPMEGGLEMKADKFQGEKLENKAEASQEPEENNENQAEKQEREYEQLLYLEELELVPNALDITCPVCFVDVTANEGITLRNCLHSFCSSCIVNTVRYCEEAEIKCPYRDENYACDSFLQDREIRSLVPEDVKEQLLARSVSLAEKRMGDAFHCKTPDCKGWCVIDGDINEFPCPVCGRTNCIACKNVHDNVSCWQYQQGINGNTENNLGIITEAVLQDMLMRGVAMYCPSCTAVIMKDLGCDWLRCSFCKLEICWVTRGRRWGPRGNGDNTGGCKCNLNGIKCHPNCRNCH